MMLIVVGTSGATNLPNLIVWEVKNNGGIIVDINIKENPFSNIALKSKQGFFVQAPSSVALPKILSQLKE